MPLTFQVVIRSGGICANQLLMQLWVAENVAFHGYMREAGRGKRGNLVVVAS